jgi:hypothetical protein
VRCLGEGLRGDAPLGRRVTTQIIDDGVSLKWGSKWGTILPKVGRIGVSEKGTGFREQSSAGIEYRPRGGIAGRVDQKLVGGVLFSLRERDLGPKQDAWS